MELAARTLGVGSVKKDPGGRDGQVGVVPEMVCVRYVAERILDCSPRSVYRMSDSGRMPRPMKLGGLVRWRREELEAWVAAGCPDVRKTGWSFMAEGRVS